MLIIFICADLVLFHADCSFALHFFAAETFTIIIRRVDGSPEIAQIERKD